MSTVLPIFSFLYNLYKLLYFNFIFNGFNFNRFQWNLLNDLSSFSLLFKGTEVAGNIFIKREFESVEHKIKPIEPDLSKNVDPPIKKRRGRPKGSKNKKYKVQAPRRPRGRPPKKPANFCCLENQENLQFKANLKQTHENQNQSSNLNTVIKDDITGIVII